MRESELKLQIDKLRAEKRELEARKGGVDLKAMQEGDVLVKQVKGEMEAMRSQYQAVVVELQVSGGPAFGDGNIIIKHRDK
jgi:hypothetical protein